MIIPTNGFMLAMMGFQELIIPLLWIVAPIVAYVLIRKRQGRKPAVIWILLMVPFGWLAFLAAILHSDSSG
jgi:hypothetical protein